MEIGEPLRRGNEINLQADGLLIWAGDWCRQLNGKSSHCKRFDEYGLVEDRCLWL